jgi:hypothetical protein
MDRDPDVLPGEQQLDALLAQQLPQSRLIPGRHADGVRERHRGHGVLSGSARPASPRQQVAAAACGLTAAALALLVPVLGGWAEPGYSHVGQYISELGAVGAAHPTLVAALGFAPIGVLVLAFVVLVAPLLPASRLARGGGLVGLAVVGAAYLVAAWFPCDAGCPSEGSPAQLIHNLFGLLEYVGAAAGLIALGVGLRRSPAWRRVGNACLVAAAMVTLGLVAGLAPGLAPVRGLSQRLAEGAIFGWLALASVRLLDTGRSRWR